MFGDIKVSEGDIVADTLVAAFGLRPLLLPMYIVPFLLTLIWGPSFPPKEAARDDNDCVAASAVAAMLLVVPLGVSSDLGPNRI